MSTRAFFSVLALALLFACGGDDAPPPDGGGGRDGTVGTDGGGRDGALADGGGDDGSTGDDGGGTDGGTPEDGGPTPDGGTTCPPDLGAFCGDGVPCATGYECMIGRCAPQGRQTCGGFVGAECTMAPYTECLYFESADFGPCFTAAERDCLCAMSDPGFVCS